MPQPTKRTVAKARRAAMRKQLKEDRQYLRVLELGWNYVLFRYGGYEIRFEYYQGRLARNGGEHLYLQPADYELLFDWADMLLTAQQQARKQKKRGCNHKSTTPEVQLAWHF
jgi:hypothetical protein